MCITNKAVCSCNKHDDQDEDKMNTLKFVNILLVKIFPTLIRQYFLPSKFVLSRQNRSPPKIGPAGLILAEKLAKTGPPDHFCCQNWSGRTDFGCQKGPLLSKSVPHGGPILAKNICQLPKLVPLKVALLFLRVHGYMDAAIISSYAWLSS